jgi:MFS family permease
MVPAVGDKIFMLVSPIKMLSRDLKLIYLSNLAGSFGDGLYAYIMPYYIIETLKAGPVEIGILYAIMGLSASLTLFMAGMLADRYDRKKILIAGWIVWLPTPLIFSLAENWLQMLPGMVLWGVWLGGPTGTAYIVSSADKNRMTSTFTTISSSFSLGYIFSPALGGYLAGTTSMRIVFYLAFAFYGLASILLCFIRSQYARKNIGPTPEKRSSILGLLKTSKLLVLSAFLGSAMFIMLFFRPFIPTFLADVYHYGSFEIGFLGSVSFFGSAVLGILLGRLGDKTRKSYALAMALALCSLSLILLLASGDLPILTLTHFILGASYLAWPLMSAIIGPLAPESIRAFWIAIPQTVGMFTSVMAPYIGGILYEVSPYYPCVAGTVASLFLAVAAFAKTFDE